MRVEDEANQAEGSLTLPESIREKMGLRAGDLLEAFFESDRDKTQIVLTLQKPEKTDYPRIVTDPMTGLPVLTAGPNAPPLTNEQVLEMLADFP